MSDVLLGYLEKPRTPLVLDSRYFPSKFGGKPAWLNPQNLPQYRDLQCNICGTRMRFLLQVYAPQDDREDLFHRSIFLFICTNCTCSVQAFRCQLPRMNEYYDYNPAPTSFLFEDVNPEETILELKELQFNNICNTCGLPLSTESKRQQSNTHDKCNGIDSGTSKVILDEFSLDIEICSTEEEDEDDDQEEAQDDNSENDPGEETTPITGENDLGFEELSDKIDNINNESCNILGREQRINCEKKHFESVDKQNIDPKSSEYKLFQDYKKKFSENIDNVLDDSEMKAFGKISNSNTEKDILFDKFINNSRKYPGHIIRYSHKGSPLWISDKNIPSETPQKCPLCNSNRVFEFQIQPEAIVLGNLPNKVEFGVIAVFTCSNNCQIDYYAPEYVLIQNNPY
ncbi:Programmed cell death protein 2 C-terminal putative domain protein [Cryptosporidium meleagridis]|uniref:Programmed cell death protein 2 C-terminal putative domain protein n=1 Tax=Cryptosporidium meleagridis TaxID=93969 RepID=A0A2P4YZG6_9CRYT|nr:Programmed cell death protein 2 C-terminal putative domain protein [Cryptosporidium meleagridis]